MFCFGGSKRRSKATADPVLKSQPPVQDAGCKRLRIDVRGAVQGVGFRPFVYRLAERFGVAGWVRNGPDGVCCEVEANEETLTLFMAALRTEAPPLADVHSIESSQVPPTGEGAFAVWESETKNPVSAFVLPDVATCPDCLDEIFDPANKRYLYSFTNCTNCGPRYSIVESLPYDRCRTSMADFQMCPACATEYADPADRRFHAEPNCCPECGPRLSAVRPDGSIVAERHDALLAAAVALRAGEIVAVKGIGGYLLFADARRVETVQRLRDRKRRPDKPFAVMCPSLAEVEVHCDVSAVARELLQSPQAPIVLLPRRTSCDAGAICADVAPRSPDLGMLLPYAPLHHILMAELGFPVVATSGNVANEPLASGNAEALGRLGGIADLFLMHDRPIVARIDDSVVRVVDNAPLILRRARGCSPYPIGFEQAREDEGPVILGVGGHLANTICLDRGNDARLGPHIGDLESPEALNLFEQTTGHLSDLGGSRPDAIACDLHPDYRSSRFAAASGLPLVSVQHHVAHAAAVAADRQMDGPVLGIAWDGTGLGDDGTLWGGEFLMLDKGAYRRVAHLRPFRLPGGDAVAREPWRTALGVLWELEGRLDLKRPGLAALGRLTDEEVRVFSGMLEKGLNAPLTSSAGRLFDAVSALAGVRHAISYQGQAAIELEWMARKAITNEIYPFSLPQQIYRTEGPPLVLDWRPMIAALLRDLSEDVSIPTVAAKFHNTLAVMIAAVVEWQGANRVVLSGGCFQNTYLCERVIDLLASSGVEALLPRRVPPNDGSLSFGQAVWARAMIEGGHCHVSRHSG
ncbi:MAG: carbamoyltransferase HypF [Parvibaculaceae bacterium]